MADIKVVIAGAGGQMGAANIRAVHAAKGMVVHAAIDRSGADSIGMDAGVIAGLPALEIAITDDASSALDGADAVIDFTAPMASISLAEEVAERGLVHIVGTTGMSEDDEVVLKRMADQGAIIVKSGNMSLGVNLLASLVKKTAAALGEEFDIEVVEMHHRRKVDAPSGTALLLGQAAADGRNIDLAQRSVRSRDGHTGARPEGDIGFATLRGGTVVGDHSVVFAGPSERIVLSHVAEDRALFANGAIKAVQWAVKQPKGFYSMADVLGL